MAEAKWQGFPSGGKAESLSLFSSSSIAEKSGGIFSSLPANLPTPNVLLVFARTFGVGKFAGKEEKIPPDFSAIEDELKRLKDSAFPPDGKPCHFAPAIKF